MVWEVILSHYRAVNVCIHLQCSLTYSNSWSCSNKELFWGPWVPIQKRFYMNHSTCSLNLCETFRITLHDILTYKKFRKIELSMKVHKKRNWKLIHMKLLYYQYNVLLGCETWSLTVREEQRLRVFDNISSYEDFGAKRYEITGECRKLHNAELHYCILRIT